MKIIRINGYSDSGKTTTAENLIAELKRRGRSVGSVKEIYCADFKIDTGGTDTDRHAKAGAELVTARGKCETDVMFLRRLPIEEILRFYDYDYCILEGVADIDSPKIITARTEAEIDDKIDGNTIAVSGVIANRIREYKGLPVINCITDIGALADLVESKAPENTHSIRPVEGGISLRIGGERVQIDEDAQKALRAAILNAVNGLGIYADGEDIELSIGNKDDH